MPARKIDRRTALALFGGSVGAVALAACAGSDEGPAASGTTSTSGAAGTTSTSGTAAAVTTGSVTVADFGAAASCSLTPEETEGPYYIDVDKIRADIREDRTGTELLVAARIMDADGCTPIKDAVFEIWHADADGVYSGFGSAGGGPGGPGGGRAPDNESRFLRGAQVTDADGIARITTVYPGWYPGRTTHIHVKVFISNAEVLTTQLFFDEKVNSAVYATAPYNAHTGRQSFNTNDGIFLDETMLTLKKDGDGYLGLITIGANR